MTMSTFLSGPVTTSGLYEQRFAESYAEALLWSDTHFPASEDDAEHERPFDMLPYELSGEAIKTMRADCAQFVRENDELLAWLDENGYGPEQAGGDFALTRNGHGAGFWDRGLGVPGDILTDSADLVGEQSLYLGDDNLIYAS